MLGLKLNRVGKTGVPMYLPAHTDLFDDLGYFALEHGMQDLDDEEEAKTEDDESHDQQDGPGCRISQVTLREQIITYNIKFHFKPPLKRKRKIVPK